VNAVGIAEVVAQMRDWIQERSRQRTIAVTGMHGVMEARHDARFKAALESSDAIVPDGMPLIWFGRYRGLKLKRRVYGPELMLAFCAQDANRNCRHYFYGAAPGVAERLVFVLKGKFPGLQVAGIMSPPFRALTEEEDEGVVRVINAASPDVLWVGLGTPKQETWMTAHRARLRVPVIVTVGAAFDINAGLKEQAPEWMREHGFEWLFRLMQEPKRLWRRYIVYGMEFIFRLSLELTRMEDEPPAEDITT
jgi:N-acetylglucosaminyldiphosphoundecaprenol N-acetyl-beta-D-mannosaminyltransferase